jgi:hypothetical protein
MAWADREKGRSTASTRGGLERPTSVVSRSKNGRNLVDYAATIKSAGRSNRLSASIHVATEHGSSRSDKTAINSYQEVGMEQDPVTQECRMDVPEWLEKWS